MIADKAYSHPSTRHALGARGIAFTCPERADQIARRKAKGRVGGRPPGFDLDLYRRRNVVERCFGRLKQFRGLATRFDKRVAYYRAEVVIATHRHLAPRLTGQALVGDGQELIDDRGGDGPVDG
jgi:transposase